MTTESCVSFGYLAEPQRSDASFLARSDLARVLKLAFISLPSSAEVKNSVLTRTPEPARKGTSCFNSFPSSQASHGLDAMTAWKSAGFTRIAWSAKLPPAECPAKMRSGTVRYRASAHGI